MIDYALAADLLALVHLAFVAFVVGGQGAILVGVAAGWAWVRHPGLRWGHAAAMAIVVAQVVAGVYCPLTLLEARWRALAGEEAMTGTFIGHWARRLLYVDVPLWQTHLAYLAFAALVAWSWWRYPPRRR